MRQFFKFLFASCLGTLLALFVLFLIGSSLVISAVEAAERPREIGPNSVLHLKLNQNIPELMENVELTSLDPTRPPVLGLHDVTRTIRRAKEDDQVKGIFLETDMMLTGFSSTTVIREALEDFRSSGKFVIAFAPYYSQGAYYLASAADAVYVAPQGIIDFRGFSAQVPFIKTMLDRVGIQMEVFYAGEFKSATEPIRRTSMSPESKLQTRAYLEAIYGMMLERVSTSRDVPVARLREAANTFAGIDPQLAKSFGLIDDAVYRENVIDELRRRIGLNEDEEPRLVRLNEYFDARVGQDHGGDRVALIIAEGTIVDGESEGGTIGDKEYVKLIDRVREDDRVKAVVLRVNSPGGSASASDHIWFALERLRASGKPLFVSMGDYAASGGYYIACNADSIYAQPSTLTGSIGVFNVFPQAQQLLNEKLGITFDTVKTADLSSAFTPFLSLSDREKQLLQKRTDDLYRTYLSRVAEGRKMTVAEVDAIARGRVWVGTNALEIGLVDRIGGIDEAIAGAAGQAGLDNYSVVTYPEAKSPWQRLIEEFTEREEVLTRYALREQLGSYYPHYRYLRELSQGSGEQMRLPFVLSFE